MRGQAPQIFFPRTAPDRLVLILLLTDLPVAFFAAVLVGGRSSVNQTASSAVEGHRAVLRFVRLSVRLFHAHCAKTLHRMATVSVEH